MRAARQFDGPYIISDQDDGNSAHARPPHAAPGSESGCASPTESAVGIIENSSAILFRLGTGPACPIDYVSRNVCRYGFVAEQLVAVAAATLVHADDIDAMRDAIERVRDGRSREESCEARIRTADGRDPWFEFRIHPSAGPGARAGGVEGLAIDIGKRKADESYLAHFTSTDQLTGLGNRIAFNNELRRAFAAARRRPGAFAIHFIDLDNFRDVNDVHGHSKGDELLVLVGQRLREAKRGVDYVARFGGDEFAVLQGDIGGPEEAQALAARILHTLSEPPYDLGARLDITASIGIAVFNGEAASPEDMLKQADVALYRAKDTGRNRFHFHSEELESAIRTRVALSADLRLALERNELELYYQPEIDVASGRMIGLEALVRWHHPRLGLLGADQFVPLAEKSGSILALGRWVTDAAFRQLATWRLANLAPPTIAINVSAAQMQSSLEFDRELSQTFNKWQIEPGAIEIELTESVLMETTREHRMTIDRLRALGVSIAIDDFGTGYSSLDYLRNYRVSRIKIAQEFVRNLQRGAGDIAIIRAAIGLAHELGINVVAEGVETAQHLDLLREAGCRYMQGFYFSPPVTAARAAEFLRRGMVSPAATVEDAPS